MPATKALSIELSPDHERQLKELARAHSTPQKLAEAVSRGIVKSISHGSVGRLLKNERISSRIAGVIG